MSKSVLMTVDNRKMKITFHEDAVVDRDEFTALDAAFRRRCAADSELSRRVSSAVPIRYSLFDADFDDWVEIGPNEPIPDKCRIEAKIPENAAVASAAVALPIIAHQQPAATSGGLIDNGSHSVSSVSNSGTAHENFAGHYGGQAAAITNDRVNPYRRCGGSGKVFSITMPRFSSGLESDMRDGKLLMNVNRFVRECANHLLAFAEHPRRSDYDSFGRMLVEAYPVLKDVNGTPHGSFVKQLGKCIRNRRFRENTRRKVLHSDGSGPPSKLRVGSIVSLAAQESFDVGHEEPAAGDTDLASVLSERVFAGNGLYAEQPKYADFALVPDDRGGRIRELRNFGSVQAALEAHPEFRDTNLLLHEFSALVTFDIELLREPFMAMVANVCMLYNLEAPTSDSDIFRSVTHACRQSSRNYGPLVQLCEGGRRLNLKSHAKQPPFLKVVLENGAARKTFVLGEGATLLSVDRLDSFLSCLLLVAVYVVFDVPYPRPYHLFFVLVQADVLESDFQEPRLSCKAATHLKRYRELKHAATASRCDATPPAATL